MPARNPNQFMLNVRFARLAPVCHLVERRVEIQRQNARANLCAV